MTEFDDKKRGGRAIAIARGEASTNVDHITDFNVAADTIRLDNAAMQGLGVALGTLAAKFWKGTTGLAHDAEDRIIYQTDTGKLFYAANGIGARAPSTSRR